jgi:hypothetical protein
METSRVVGGYFLRRNRFRGCKALVTFKKGEKGTGAATIALWKNRQNFGRKKYLFGYAEKIPLHARMFQYLRI